MHCTHSVKENLVLSERGDGGNQPAVPKEPLADIKSTGITGDEHWMITEILLGQRGQQKGRR